MRLFVFALVAFNGLAAPPLEQKLHVRIPMRDGTRLCAHVLRPAGRQRLPALLIRTPYGKGPEVAATYRSLAENGYAVIVQDVRGRYDSGGVFAPLTQEPNDGSDTLDWIARQPWSNGRVGMLGGSYLGIVQWKAALTGNPHLKAISPVVSGWDDYRDRFYSSGGAMKIGNRLLWMSQNLRAPGFPEPEFNRFVLHIPLRTADRAATGQRSQMLQDALDHPVFDSFWKAISTREQIDRVRVPVFSIGGWYDNFGQSDLEAFAALRRLNRDARTMIGPWPHNMSAPFSGIDFGSQAQVPVRKLQLQWFDYWLKSDGSRPAPPWTPLRIFVMGRNQWRDERQWPPAAAVGKEFYLAGTSGANGLDGGGELLAKPQRGGFKDVYQYDPRNPVPTAGGAVCCNPKIFAWGPRDQVAVEKRKDVLVYTSRELKKDLEVTGPVVVHLYVSTSAPDTDFTAKLVDVFPDGGTRNLTDGILRMRYRTSLEKVTLAEPGEIYPIRIDAGVTSNVFLRGHRLRLEIASSNFPRFDRNPNTGRPVSDETEFRVASQTVYRGQAYPSHVILQVIGQR